MQFLNKQGLGTFLAQLKDIFGRRLTLEEAAAARELYLLNIDYEKELAFDTSLIVSGGASSSILGVGQLGMMVIGS